MTPNLGNRKLSKCPECGGRHKATFDSLKARPSWEIWCPIAMKSRNVINPKYEN